MDALRTLNIYRAFKNSAPASRTAIILTSLLKLLVNRFKVIKETLEDLDS